MIKDFKAEIKDSRARRIGPIDVAVLTYHDALELTADLIEHRSGIVAFCNAHSVNLARRDQGFSHAMKVATVLNDGIGLDLASRLLHKSPFPANLNGTDFTPAVLTASPRPLRLFLLGSSPGVAERAAAALRAHYPRHIVVGTHHGFFPIEKQAVVANMVAASEPDLVLVGMGQPRQERWAAEYAPVINATIMCIGAFLDFSAGEVIRAPGWIRKIRLEWTYRLLQEPQRLAKRYLIGNAVFLTGIIGDKFAGR